MFSTFPKTQYRYLFFYLSLVKVVEMTSSPFPCVQGRECGRILLYVSNRNPSKVPATLPLKGEGQPAKRSWDPGPPPLLPPPLTPVCSEKKLRAFENPKGP